MATHIPTAQTRERVKDLVCAGIPKRLICKVLEINEVTLDKYYELELECSMPKLINDIAKVVAIQALDGNEKSQALYLKTQGAKYGWVEKQVIEQTSNEDSEALKLKIQELEEKYTKDY